MKAGRCSISTENPSDFMRLVIVNFSLCMYLSIVNFSGREIKIVVVVCLFRRILKTNYPFKTDNPS